MQQAPDLSFIFWLILLMLFFYPQLRHQALRSARLKLIRSLERKRGSKVITMIHRQERIGLFGIPFYRYIDIEDSEQVLRAIRSTPPDTPIDLILHTPGGLVLASAQIAMAIKDHPGKTTVIVPHYAMSGGTLIALAADNIIMDRHAVLGPVDPQLSDPKYGAVPAASVLRAVKEKGADKVDDATLIKADIAEKAISQMRELIVELTEGKLGREKAEELARALTEGRWTHDYPLTPRRLRELGVEVSHEMPPEVYALMELYPQPHQQRPTVEFIPGPAPAPYRQETRREK
ncbi:MAG: hypothetical protein DRN99_05695 [Thermoproteota archaeon]|nr:MAG: hypothetical protein DRN99_05695 [Candidatus Korarchaeota archaeon]